MEISLYHFRGDKRNYQSAETAFKLQNSACKNGYVYSLQMALPESDRDASCIFAPQSASTPSSISLVIALDEAVLVQITCERNSRDGRRLISVSRNIVNLALPTQNVIIGIQNTLSFEFVDLNGVGLMLLSFCSFFRQDDGGTISG